jgi:hypothetical protein
MEQKVHALLEDPRLWRAGRHERRWATLSSGDPRLDALLPGGGWPAAMLTEIAVERWGSGELALFLPLLARLCATGPGEATRWIAWIAPPFLPYAPALAAAGVDLARLLLVHPRDDTEALWATEQALRSGSCSAVLAWARRANGRQLRRLQLAAEHGRAPLILFRPLAALAEASPAGVRLRLAMEQDGACLHFVKQRGGGSSVSLPWHGGKTAPPPGEHARD